MVMIYLCLFKLMRLSLGLGLNLICNNSVLSILAQMEIINQIQLLGAGAIAPDMVCIPGMSIQVPENCRPVGKWCNLCFHLAHEFPVALLIDCQNCSLSLL